MNSRKSKLSLLAECDDFMIRYKILLDEPEQKFLEILDATTKYNEKFSGIKEELLQLQKELCKSKEENVNLQMKLKNARQLLDVERSKRVIIEREKYDLERQISMVVEMLGQGNVNETKERLQVLSSTFSNLHHGADVEKFNIREVLSPNHLSTINEDADTLGSILNVSDMDLTDGDEFELSKTRSGKSFPSPPLCNGSGNKRKSLSKSRISKRNRTSKTDEEVKENCIAISDKACLGKAVEYHSKVDLTPSAPSLSFSPTDKVGNDATPFRSTPFGNSLRQTPSESQVYTPVGMNLYISPGNSTLMRNYSNSKVNGRQHCFMSKMIYWTDFCQACEKRMKFGKAAYKCRDCRAMCHMECKDAVPLPCVPTVNTPNNRGHVGYIVDFAPRVSPMVPALIIHCTNEVESRGLNEVGIYRVPGSDKEVKDLRDRFLKGKGVPNLASIDIHVVCGAIKSFLRILKEPLIPNSLWKDFVSAIDKKEQQDAFAILYQAISDMPQPNRDTLSWMICHLHKVAECTECKMPPTNLARIFGPTLLGYSVVDPDPLVIIEETKLQQKVVELLLEISSDYWETFITVPEEPITTKFTTPEKCYSSSRRRSILSSFTLPQLDTPRHGSKK